MATHYRSFGTFDESRESWKQYVERLTQYFLANDIEDQVKKRAHLITLLAPSTYGLLRSLISPDKPEERSFEELVQALNKHYCVPPSEIVERFHFNSRNRKSGESITTYTAELRRLAEHCHFGNTLNDMLRDRIVCGIQEESIQRRLLAETSLTLDKALRMALLMEQAQKDALDIQNKTNRLNGHEINKVNSQTSTRHGNRKARETNTATNTTAKHGGKICFRCGKHGHIAPQCAHNKSKCNKCGKMGHLARICRSVGNNCVQVHSLAKMQDSEEGTETFQLHELFHINTSYAQNCSQDALRAELLLNGKPVLMEIDTGASLSLMSEESSVRAFGNLQRLKPSKVILKSFTGQKLTVLGTLDVNAEFRGRKMLLPLVIVKENGPTLCGRNWLFSTLEILSSIVNNSEINEVAQDNLTLESILHKHRVVFQPELGTLQGVKVHLQKKEGCTAKFYGPRSVPYAYKELVDGELQRLEKEGVIKPVTNSEMAAPIVPVLKADKKSVRICGDFKLTTNKVIDTEKYPIPREQDIFAKLAGGKKFSKLDLKNAFNQLELDDESRKLVVINTQKGLYAYTRLPFGVSSSPAIFQKHLESLLQSVEGASNFQDDILVTGKDDQEHLRCLDKVLDILEKAGLRLNYEKCKFFTDSVEYLGHRLDAEGLHPLQNKIDAIVKAPAPTNLEQLRSYLGLLAYYSKFLPSMAVRLAPLYSLLRKDVPWNWTKEHDDAFHWSKEALKNSKVLVHFDPCKELWLACDASPYGIGAVLSHRTGDLEQPIAFASRTLTTAERNYSQLERESLALVFGVVRFRDYLLGRKFKLVTDHRPLVCLFSESKPVPVLASGRVQRWALSLSVYDYEIVYRPGREHGNADALSRLPIPVDIPEPPCPAEIILAVESFIDGPVDFETLRLVTLQDDRLCKLKDYIQYGWSDTCPEDLREFWNSRNALTVHREVIFREGRVLIPRALQEKILKLLHENHPGMVQSKRLARTRVWWPGLDKQLENTVRTCSSCQQVADMPRAQYSEWPKSTRPWERVHIDYAGPMENDRMILVIVDTYSHWIEAIVTNSSTSAATIDALLALFARFGIPECMVSDNGACFTSAEMKEFLQGFGVRHLFTAPYHPASNGAAERSVRYIKSKLLKVIEGSLHRRLQRILMEQHRMPIEDSREGKSPAQLMFGRQIITKLDLLNSEPRKSDVSFKTKFKPGDKVLVRNFGKGSKWIEGTVSSVVGNKMFKVQTNFGLAVRHANQLRTCYGKSTSMARATDRWVMLPNFGSDVTASNNHQQILRRSTRVRRQPERYGQ